MGETLREARKVFEGYRFKAPVRRRTQPRAGSHECLLMSGHEYPTCVFFLNHASLGNEDGRGQGLSPIDGAVGKPRAQRLPLSRL